MMNYSTVPIPAKILLACLFLLSPAFVLADAATVADKWDAILKDTARLSQIDDINVVLVDYKEIKSDPRWTALLQDLESSEVPTARDEAKAFWMNAYNILAIDVVLSQYPVESIRDVGPWYSTVWKMDAGEVNGKMYSLDYIEHQILRKMGDPLIHAGIVCASVSCPNLRDEAFRGANVQQQLDEQMEAFLSDATKGARIEGNTLYLSKIFDWFSEDFGSIKDFVRKHAPEELASQISSSTSIDYFDYNWKLNDDTATISASR